MSVIGLHELLIFPHCSCKPTMPCEASRVCIGSVTSLQKLVLCNPNSVNSQLIVPYHEKN